MVRILIIMANTSPTGFRATVDRDSAKKKRAMRGLALSTRDRNNWVRRKRKMPVYEEDSDDSDIDYGEYEVCLVVGLMVGNE